MNPKPQREGEIEKILKRFDSTISLWRPYFYKKLISKKDLPELRDFLRKELSSLIREERRRIKAYLWHEYSGTPEIDEKIDKIIKNLEKE